MSSRLATITTLLTYGTCRVLSIPLPWKQLNNPAVALPVSVMLWRELLQGSFGTCTFHDSRRKRQFGAYGIRLDRAEAQECRYEPW
jgi:hypothetical protein